MARTYLDDPRKIVQHDSFAVSLADRLVEIFYHICPVPTCVIHLLRPLTTVGLFRPLERTMLFAPVTIRSILSICSISLLDIDMIVSLSEEGIKQYLVSCDTVFNV